jgi:hypothetical protein
MSKVRLYGATSGYVELQAPAVAGDVVVTLPDGEIATESYVDNSLDGYATKSSVSGHIAMITGERNGALTAGQNLAFGNGATNKEAPMSYAGEVIAMAVSPGPSHTGSTTIELVKNGTEQGVNYRIVASGTSVNSLVFSSPLVFAAGDSLVLRCTGASTPGDGLVGSFTVRFS